MGAVIASQMQLTIMICLSNILKCVNRCLEEVGFHKYKYKYISATYCALHLSFCFVLFHLTFSSLEFSFCSVYAVFQWRRDSECVCGGERGKWQHEKVCLTVSLRTPIALRRRKSSCSGLPRVGWPAQETTTSRRQRRRSTGRTYPNFNHPWPAAAHGKRWRDSWVGELQCGSSSASLCVPVSAHSISASPE